MGKFRQLSPELWPLIDVFFCSYIELIFRGGVSCLPAALLLHIGNISLPLDSQHGEFILLKMFANNSFIIF